MIRITGAGLKYDTRTATKLGQLKGQSVTGSAAQIRNRAWTETLYVTPNGRLFLACEGGKRSRHRIGDGEHARPGKRIELFTKAQALQWALGQHALCAKILAIDTDPLDKLAKQRTST